MRPTRTALITLLSLILIAGLLTGCAGSEPDASSPGGDGAAEGSADETPLGTLVEEGEIPEDIQAILKSSWGGLNEARLMKLKETRGLYFSSMDTDIYEDVQYKRESWPEDTFYIVYAERDMNGVIYPMVGYFRVSPDGEITMLSNATVEER